MSRDSKKAASEQVSETHPTRIGRVGFLMYTNTNEDTKRYVTPDQ